jgi:hypothetical protein
MALEILTVIKTPEEELVPMLALSREETISVLTTLLRDQDLAEVADEWYEQLSLWRLPVFVPEPSPARSDLSEGLTAVPSSRLEALRDALALDGSTHALPDSDQSPALPLDELDQEPVLGGRSIRIALRGSLEQTEEPQADDS